MVERTPPTAVRRSALAGDVGVIHKNLGSKCQRNEVKGIEKSNRAVPIPLTNIPLPTLSELSNGARIKTRAVCDTRCKTNLCKTSTVRSGLTAEISHARPKTQANPRHHGISEALPGVSCSYLVRPPHSKSSTFLGTRSNAAQQPLQCSRDRSRLCRKPRACIHAGSVMLEKLMGL